MGSARSTSRRELPRPSALTRRRGAREDAPPWFARRAGPRYPTWLEAEVEAGGQRDVVRDVVLAARTDLVVDVVELLPVERRDVVLRHQADADRLADLEVHAEAGVEGDVGRTAAAQVVAVGRDLDGAGAELRERRDRGADAVRDER